MKSHAHLPAGHITEKVIGAFYQVYNEMGHGFLESVYSGALAIAFRERHLTSIREFPITVKYHGEIVGAYRADHFVESAVVVEVKAARQIGEHDREQLFNYLRGTGVGVGLLLNFGPEAKFIRMVNAATRTSSAL